MSDNSQTLLEHFPQILSADGRTGYQGVMVDPSNLLQVVSYVRDQLGYDFLSSVTGVDYLPEGKMEVVYHFYKSTGGSELVLKSQSNREKPAFPSLVPLFPGAEFQEREAWDLLGIHFDNHPDLRRILMWEGFEGFPLRKDWKEAFYEADAKAFTSRHPDGHIHRAEDKNAFGNNVAYPHGYNPEGYVFEGDESIYKIMQKREPDPDVEPMGTQQIVVNMGPQHPSTHGVFRMVVTLDGETIVDLKPVMGYLHRNHEKIAERNTYLMNMPFTDRLDYICSMSNNFGYALAVEKLLGSKVPERAEYIRVIMAELTRISNHLIAIGTLLNDLGAYFTPMLYALEERELILDVFEAVSGSRMMCNYFRFGGVARDLPDGITEKIKALVFERLLRTIDELDTYLSKNEIVRTRCEGVGVLRPEQALAYSVVGPMLRASGIPYDVRRADPYSIYDRFDFDVVVAYHGDVYDRYLVRLEEMRQSVRIIQQAIQQIPEGPVLSDKVKHDMKVPAGEAYGRVEGPKGELGYYVVSNGTKNPWRYHVRAPSFINLTPLALLCNGGKVADAIIALGSVDIVLGETDR